jgi:hypothetical protein
MEVRSRLDSGHGCERSDIASDDLFWAESGLIAVAEQSVKADIGGVGASLLFGLAQAR